MLSILGIQMHIGGCEVVGSQMAELNFYQVDYEMTYKSSQFDKTVISLCQYTCIIIDIFFSTIYGILVGPSSFKAS